MLMVRDEEDPRAGLGEGFRDVLGEGSLPCCKCGGADLIDVLSSIAVDVVDLAFFLLPGVSFSVGSRTYIRWPFESVRHRSRVMGVLVPRLPTPPSASSSSSSSSPFFFFDW
jgi:hypothetical protein